MVFSSIPFLFFFLPVCLIFYYAVPYSFKNGVLLIFSLIFYAWGEPVYILLMLFAAAVDYINGRFMEIYGTTRKRRRVFLFVSVLINLSVLGFFKYADFFILSANKIFRLSIPVLGLGLPVGISFFTFQTMSYSIDLYRGQVETEKSYLNYLTYVSMFPQLVAGPIVRFQTVSRELHSRTIDRDQIRAGGLRFIRGLFKKVLIANQIGSLWEEICRMDVTGISAATAWLGAVSFTLQLYFDFSAYSDMAIGMGRMLGFYFPENFNYPLYATSVTDFWRRWHISLSTWFRDYVYIPLGGNRAGKAKHLRNIMIVWMLTGLWHGAAWNFVFWGLYYGILLAFEKYVWGEKLSLLPAALRRVYSLLIVVVGFVIFSFEDRNALSAYLGAMAAWTDSGRNAGEFFWYLGNYKIVLAVSVILAFPVYPFIKEKIAAMGDKAKTLTAVAEAAGYALLFIWTAAFLVSDTYNPFLYFRF